MKSDGPWPAHRALAVAMAVQGVSAHGADMGELNQGGPGQGFHRDGLPKPIGSGDGTRVLGRQQRAGRVRSRT